MLRRAIRVKAHHAGPRQVGRIFRPCPRTRSPDLHGAIAALRNEAQPVVEILGKGGEEGIGIRIRCRPRCLRTKDVRDRPRIQPVEDRVDRVVARGGVIVARTVFGDADEGLAMRALRRVGRVVAHPRQRPHAQRIGTVIIAVRVDAADKVKQTRRIIGRQRRGRRPIAAARRSAASPRIRPGAAFGQRRQGIRRSGEGDAMAAIGHGHGAIAIVGRGIAGRIVACRHLDHVLLPQRPHHHVVAATRAEHDPVRRGQFRDVDHVIAFGPVHPDRVDPQAGARKAADRNDGIRSRPGIDDDLLDSGQFRDHARSGTDAAGDHDLGRRRQRGPRIGGQEVRPRKDAIGLGLVVAVDDEGIPRSRVCTAVDDVAPVQLGGNDRETKERHRVRHTPVDHVIPGTGVDRVIPAIPGDDVIARRSGQRVRRPGSDDRGPHGRGRGRGHGFDRALPIGEGHAGPQLQPRLSSPRREGRRRLTGDRRPCHAIGRRLPAKGQRRRRRVEAIGIRDARRTHRQRLPRARRGVADRQRPRRRDVRVDDRRRRGRSHRFGEADAIGEADLQTQLRPDLRLTRLIARRGRPCDIRPGRPVGGGLPLKREGPQPVFISDGGEIRRQHLIFRRRGVADDGRARRGNGVHRVSTLVSVGIDRLDHPIGILELGHGTDRKAFFRRRDGIGRAGHGGEIVGHDPQDIGKHPAACRRFHLPAIFDPGPDRPGRIGGRHVIRIRHRSRRGPQNLSCHADGLAIRCRHAIHRHRHATFRDVILMRRDLHRAIGKQDAFDVLHAVHAIGAPGAGVGDGDPAIAIRIGRHTRQRVMALDRVIGQIARILGHVDVTHRRAIGDLAPDAQFAGLDLAAEHPLLDLGHAPHEIRCRAAFGRHPDQHVQEAVAVDQVIAAPAFDDVTAAAAKNDVPRAETHLARFVHAGQEGLQPVHQRHVPIQQRVIDRQVGLFIAAQQIRPPRPRKRLGLRITVKHRRRRRGHGRGGEQPVRHVRLHTGRRIRMAGPVKAQLTEELVGPAAAHHDVVAGFGVEVIVAGTADQHVMADDRAVHAALDGQTLHEVAVVAQEEVVRTAGLKPVIALPAHDHAATDAATAKVIVLTQQKLVEIRAAPDKVAARIGDDQVEPLTRIHHIVAGTGTHLVIAELVGDGVVAHPAEMEVVAFAAFHAVIAAIAPEAVIALAADQDVIAFRPAKDHMLGPGKADVIHHAVAIGILTDDLRLHGQQDAVTALGRVGAAQPGIELPRLVDLDIVIRGREDVARQVRRGRVAVDHVGKLVVFQLRRQVQVGQTRQVIEPVRILQRFKLHFEDEVEGRSQHPAEDHLLLGQTADPEVHIVQTTQTAPGIGIPRIQEVQTVGGRIRPREDKVHRRFALGFGGLRQTDRLMRPVGRDEVDDGHRVFQVQREIEPARIGLDLAVARPGKELRPCLVQRRHAGFTAPGDVDRRKVKRQPDKVVAQRLGHEFVDLVAALTGHPAGQGTRCLIGIQTAVGEFDRVQEGRDQIDVIGIIGRVIAIHAFVQHRMAKAIDRMGEFAKDGRVQHAVIVHKDVHEGLHLAGKFLEDQMLILHLGHELGRLEQARAIPCQRFHRHGGQIDRRTQRRSQPFVQEFRRRQQVAGIRQNRPRIRKKDVLHQLNLTVVFGMEHVMHRGQGDVLVRAAITRDIVAIQQLVVIGAGRLTLCRHADVGVRIGGLAGIGVRVMGNIVKEGHACGHRTNGIDGCGKVALHQPLHTIHQLHDLRQAILARNEVPIGIGRQQRHRMDVHVIQFDPEDVQSLRLHIGPGRHATARFQTAVQKTPGRHRSAIDQLVFPQEDLMRRMRGVGLVLVDERGDKVHRLAVLGQRGARHHHEIRVRRQRVEQRVIRLQRDVDRPEAALLHQIQTVIEELSEDGHP